ncbi:hypothetical protein [Actinomadura keratinilytica]|jgi:hypothetical protein|uniref:Uncharacterized protein n=1 Tax=Actinomadura keratinilytica TaxID=547461 RepID=A0ABP6UJ17_9ACTN
MTTRPFDYDAFLSSTPDRWRELGLHWHCYGWRGTGEEWSDEAQRQDPSSFLPPTSVRDWLGKPARMLRAVEHTPEDALAWLRDQWTPLTSDALHGDPHGFLTGETRWRLALCDLRNGADVYWTLWTAGPYLHAFAVIGTSASCHSA